MLDTPRFGKPTRDEPAVKRPGQQRTRGAWGFALALTAACSPSPAHSAAGTSDTWSVDDETPVLRLADELEQRIAHGRDTPEQRRELYTRVRTRPVVTAEDALGRAIITGRLAQTGGLSAPGLVREVETYARRSAKLDPSLREGAATRLLGTLYVMAPATIVRHGDSEDGLALLQWVVRRWPEQAVNQLRLAEAYLALGDPQPARLPLCYCVAHREQLREDHQQLLDQLLERVEAFECPRESER